jgi:hypothetical protein
MPCMGGSLCNAAKHPNNLNECGHGLPSFLFFLPCSLLQPDPEPDPLVSTLGGKGTLRCDVMHAPWVNGCCVPLAYLRHPSLTPLQNPKPTQLLGRLLQFVKPLCSNVQGAHDRLHPNAPCAALAGGVEGCARGARHSCCLAIGHAQGPLSR